MQVNSGNFKQGNTRTACKNKISKSARIKCPNNDKNKVKFVKSPREKACFCIKADKGSKMAISKSD